MINSVWKFFSSVKLTVVLLLSLAATSIVGTVIPQRGEAPFYIQKYGEVLYRFFYVLDIYDMYHAWWFQLLLGMLAANIVICSIERLSVTWKIVFTKTPVYNADRFRRRPDKVEFTDKKPPERLEKTYLPFVSKHFGRHHVDKTGNGVRIFAEKGRWSRLGVYVVHISIVLLLVGGLIGSMFGFDGYVNIAEGEAVNTITLERAEKPFSLDFQIRCDDFDVSFYESGMPKEYRSKLTVLKEGKPVLKKEIIVNDPLRYEGINIFQSSYGPIAPKAVTLLIKSPASGKAYTLEASFSVPVTMPEKTGTFVIRDYSNHFSFRGKDLGETFLGILTPPEGNPERVILPVRYPEFDSMRNGGGVISVKDYVKRYYTGLQVTRDPGVSMVYLGFILLIAGCYITFFMSHQTLFVELEKHPRHTAVTVAGLANKNKLGMTNKVEKIARSLALLAEHEPFDGPR